MYKVYFLSVHDKSNSTMLSISIIRHFNKRKVKLSLTIKIRRAEELSLQDKTIYRSHITNITM